MKDGIKTIYLKNTDIDSAPIKCISPNVNNNKPSDQLPGIIVNANYCKSLMKRNPSKV